MSLPRYPRYKPLRDQWFSGIPEHWAASPLKYTARLVTQRATGRTHAIALENIESWTGKFVPSETEFEGEGIAFEPGDVLFGKLRPYLAKVFCADIAGEAVGDFHVLRPNELLNPRFLKHCMLSQEFIGVVAGATYGSKMPRASWETIGALPVPVPPPGEQAAIVGFIEREAGKIGALIAEQSRLIELLRDKRQAVISHAVTKGLNPNAPMKPSGIEWLGDVPAHWEVLKLGRCLTSAPCYGVLVPDAAEEGVPMLRIMDMEAGTADLGELRRISRQLSDQYQRTLVREGDVVVSVVGTIGEAMVIDSAMAGVNLSRAIARLQVDERLLAEFLRLVLRSGQFQRYVDLVCVGTAQRVLNMDDLSAFQLGLATKDEQAAIVRWATGECTKLDTLAAEAQRAIDLLQERRAVLISAAVTGQIDVRGLATQEVAS